MTHPPTEPPEPFQYGHQPPQWAPPPRSKPKKWPWVLGAVFGLIVISSLVNAGEEKPRLGAAVSTSTTQAELVKAPVTTTPVPRPTTTTAVSTTTITAKTTTTTTPPPPPPTVYTGQGDDVVILDRPSGPKIAKFECPACSSNTILETDGFDSLLVNTIGAYSGMQWMDMSPGGRTTTLTVTAQGAWTLTVGGLAMATEVEGPITGSGDSVVHVTTKSVKSRITNTGDSNFIVQVVSSRSSMQDLAINTIGGYEGTVPLAGPAFVQVTSSGGWSVTPS